MEYILHIPETQIPANHAIQPAQQTQVVPRGQQQPTGPQTSCMVVDDQQPGTSRQLHFTISLNKVFKPLSVVSLKGKESAHNISGLSSILGNIQSVMRYPQIDSPQSLTLIDSYQNVSSPPTTQHQETPQQPAKLQPPAVI